MRTFFITCCALLLAACGSFQQAVQKDDSAYLQLIGKPGGEQLFIDGGQPLVLGTDTKSFNLNGKTATKISIAVGSHELRVVRGGETVIHRKIYVSPGNVFEVMLK